MGDVGYYDAEAPVYDRTRGGERRAGAAAAALEALVGRSAGGASLLLDVGGGTGIVTVELQRSRFSCVVVDRSLGMLALAGDRLPGRVLAAAADRLPVRDAAVDVVAAVWLLHLLPVPVADLVLREMVRVLRPGGRLVCTVDKDRAHGRPARPADEYHRVLDLLADLGLTPVGETDFSGTSPWGSAGDGDPVFRLVAFGRRS